MIDTSFLSMSQRLKLLNKLLFFIFFLDIFFFQYIMNITWIYPNIFLHHNDNSRLFSSTEKKSISMYIILIETKQDLVCRRNLYSRNIH